MMLKGKICEEATRGSNSSELKITKDVERSVLGEREK